LGIETRRNGNLYYYRKRRVGNKVISEYRGGGEVIQFEVAWQDCRNREREQEREITRAANIAEIDTQLDHLEKRLKVRIASSLLLAGFHRHKRQWRKRRDGGKGT
jgi:hypothetical protein